MNAPEPSGSGAFFSERNDAVKLYYALITVLGCVPYAFLALWGDAQRGTLGLYALFLAGMAALLLLCRGKDAFLAMLGADTLSCLTSCLCVLLFQREGWSGHFQPMTPLSLVFSLFLLALLLQLVAWRAIGRKRR